MIMRHHLFPAAPENDEYYYALSGLEPRFLTVLLELAMEYNSMRLSPNSSINSFINEITYIVPPYPLRNASPHQL
jgi:hypothetical protein